MMARDYTKIMSRSLVKGTLIPKGALHRAGNMLLLLGKWAAEDCGKETAPEAVVEEPPGEPVSEENRNARPTWDIVKNRKVSWPETPKYKHLTTRLLSN